MAADNQNDHIFSNKILFFFTRDVEMVIVVIIFEGMVFSAGLYARKDVKGTKNAEATQCMCDAGAILLATTNTSELAMWWESHNYVHGRSKNPYDTSRIVGGSSGGEGAVLAAAASPMGLGSDIGGSIRMPAFFNGIFGHKPSKCELF